MMRGLILSGRGDVYPLRRNGSLQLRLVQIRSTCGAMNARRMDKKKQILGRALSQSRIR